MLRDQAYDFPARRQQASHVFGSQQHQTTESRIHVLGNPDRGRLSKYLATCAIQRLLDLTGP
jgi:hypothetical protein